MRGPRSPPADQLHPGSAAAVPHTPSCSHATRAQPTLASPVGHRQCLARAGDHAAGLPGSSSIPTVPQPVPLPVGKVRGVTGGQLASPGQHHTRKPFLGEIREVSREKCTCRTIVHAQIYMQTLANASQAFRMTTAIASLL